MVTKYPTEPIVIKLAGLREGLYMMSTRLRTSEACR
jgi:hypothetical protein